VIPATQSTKRITIRRWIFTGFLLSGTTNLHAPI
jgi:hypothetical protein